MSGATYRIEVTHAPQDAPLCWWAKVYRISDNLYLTTRGGRTSDAAVSDARTWIASEASREDGFTVFADDLGHDADADAPHSVKA